jgi:glutamate/aspartate transport system permease protein
MNYLWNWNIFFTVEPVTNTIFLLYLLAGIFWTLSAAAISWTIAFSLGVLVGSFQTIGNQFIAKMCTAYVEIFRNIPLLLQMFLWFYVIPELLPYNMSQLIKNIPYPWGPFITAVFCLGIFMSTRIAEITRSGINAIAKEQWEASYSLGMNKFLTYRMIILPQVLRISIPSLTSEMCNTIKNTSLALTIGLMELTGRARATQDFTFQIFEPLLFATLTYILINLVITFLMNLLEKRFYLKNYGVIN